MGYNQRTTVISPGMGGGYGYGGGFGYNPGHFFGLNAITNGVRENRQNDMIYEEIAEVAASREREAALASRIQQLEMSQMQQGGGGGGQVQPPTIIVQPPAQLAPAQDQLAPAQK